MIPLFPLEVSSCFDEAALIGLRTLLGGAFDLTNLPFCEGRISGEATPSDKNSELTSDNPTCRVNVLCLGVCYARLPSGNVISIFSLKSHVFINLAISLKSPTSKI
ncbi:hypothetical protein D9T18_08770 [Pseudoalteromonas agarivorans]|uniref:Uncharacterized protein n=1 Tax=Pseudoalteromonas agarivorans TaxID=176102 RepID=A0AAD0U0J9_9GAMM|nr:hypothetical protein D9T18_08770 [Pseudoalteromonas agarivorans]